MEMNIFIPQSIQTMIELEEIADVRRQIITPATSVPIIGVVQDSLLGAYNLTQPTMRVDWKDAMNIISYTMIDEFDAFKKDKQYEGTELFSFIVPPKINTKRGNFIVKKGVLDPNNGVLTKRMLGSKKENSMIHLIWDEYGIEQTRMFIDNIQRLVNNFNLINGFSVGIGDIDISLELEEKMNKLFETKKLQVDHLITEIENNPDLMGTDLFEQSIYSELNTVRETVSKLVMENLKPDNNFNIMISSGSKGSDTNMGQMGGCVGQQAVEGKRIQKKVNGRTLCYFYQNDDSAMGRGFIERPYVNGMNPTEFIFHNMSSREGLIDTAIKSVTGDTPVVIMENGITKTFNIGDWIDKVLDENTEKVEHYKERDMELLNLENVSYIPTTDENGTVSWGLIKAITRHDPGKELYEIKTHGGRKVIVTESKSLLIWDKNTNSFQRMSTPDVVVGDFVPVTMKLAEPPTIVNYIDVTKYFSKENNLYGTDFNKAVSMLEGIPEDKTPNGWWNKNNGTEFSLPYKHAHRIRRAISRSKVSNVKNGNIYQYSSSREGYLPEKFELNKENGQFIGLFLAEGNVDIKSGYIQIANNDTNIKSFVKSWFEKHSIKYKESTKINNIGGTSSQVRGFSSIMGKFITKLVGHGAKHKTVLSEAFNAPEEFIIGLLDGYISGDGTITRNSIQVASASENMIHGINMLLSRLGIFGKVTKTHMKSNNIGTKDIADINMLSIRGQWASIFANKINLMSKDKNDRLHKIIPSDSHRNFQEQNDVVLDSIIEINKIDVKKYPKVYDLTIPSTLNFGLANGLHVVDTAESGYVQRKLIKSMEDITIKYDCTVRNSNNNIIQYVYGDNGLDTIKQFQHEFKSLMIGNKRLEEIYKFTKDELKKYNFSSEENDSYIKKFKDMRRHLRRSQVEITLDPKIFGAQYMLSINFYRIIENTKEDNRGSKEKLEPKYVIDKLNKVIDYSHTQLTCMSKDQLLDKKNIKHQDEILSKFVFKYSLYEFLSPKRCIVEYGFNKAQFDYIIESTVNGFNKAVVEPGEMVGIIAAQSIGEPVTQMCNSKDTMVLISGSVEYFGEVGPLIDNLMTKYKKDVINIGNDSTVLDLKDSYNIMSVSDTEKTKWSRISQVSRHPANGNLVKVTTKSGKKVTATLTHSFLKRSVNGIVPILGSELKVGMRVPVTKYIPEVANAHIMVSANGTQLNLDQEFGWLCGAYIAEGSLNSNQIRISNINNEFINRVTNFAVKLGTTVQVDRKPGEYGPGATTYFTHKNLAKFFLKNFGNGSYNKKIPAFVFSSNKTFINALLRGYFDGDGNVNSDPKRSTIRCGSRSEKLITGINLLLTYNGIVASKLQEKKMHNGEEKILHTLCIPKKYAQTYKATIGSNMTDKLKGLNEIIEWNDRECNTSQDNSDKIPELGSTIAKIGKALGLPGQSRTYGRWAKKESIGKRTLEKYIETFEKAIKDNNRFDLKADMDILTQAINATVVWDEIVSLEYLNDPKEYVYDFTVPGNHSFMVDSGLLVHNTLNTFHSAGIGSKGTTALGVPRVKELLSISKNLKTPLMQIYLDKKYQHNLEMANKIASFIKYTTIGDLRNKIDVYYDPTPFKDGGFMDKDNVKNIFHSYNPGKHSCQSDINSLPWLMRISFDREKMMSKEVTLLDMKSKFCNFWEGRYANMKGLKKEERVLLEKVTQCSILSNNDNDKIPIMHLRFDMTNFDFGTIVNFTELLIDNFKLKGIDGIEDIYGTPEERLIKLDGDNEEVEVDKEYVIYTKGVNLLELRNINGIDFGRTLCNDVAQIYEVYGIEAARASLLREMKIVLQGAGNSVNFQHLSILVDVMTSTGSCISIDRHGINKIDTNPFARASFEKTVDQFLTAAVFGEKDSMNSVSSRIMAGLVVKGGTGLCGIKLDTELLEKSEFVEDMEEKYMKTFAGVSQDPVIKDVVEKENDEDIFMPM